MKSLKELYQEHSGKVSDKWSLYLAEYDRLLAPHRHREVRLLEIGVQNGGSLEIWGKYFPNAVRLVGCDINQDCSRLEFDDERISIVLGDANAPETADEIQRASSTFDIIIDDGSHRSSDIVKSFYTYFNKLSSDGLYIVEDVHCSYWDDYEGGLFDQFSAVSFFKTLIDLVNAEHWGLNFDSEEFLDKFNQKYGIDKYLHASDFHSVEFINSMCAIRKSTPEGSRLGTRYIAGAYEEVVKGHRPLHGTSLSVPSQGGNTRSDRTLLPEQLLPGKTLEIEMLKRDVERRNEIVGELSLENKAMKTRVGIAEKELGDSRRELLAKTGEVICAHEKIRELESRVDILQQDLSLIQSSRTWKLRSRVLALRERLTAGSARTYGEHR